MDTALLKKRYGNRVIFWGAIDTHHVLPNGTPNEVCAEVNRRLASLGPDGGYIVAPAHVIQADVPPENVVALYKTVADGGLAIKINH